MRSKQSHQLARRRAQLLCGGRQVILVGSQSVQQLREKSGIIRVLWRDHHTAFAATVLPGRRRSFICSDGVSNIGGELQPQSMQGDARVLGAIAALVGFGLDTCRKVAKEDRGFGLVAMLAARSAAAQRGRLALGSQQVVIQRCGVQGSRLYHWINRAGA